MRTRARPRRRRRGASRARTSRWRFGSPVLLRIPALLRPLRLLVLHVLLLLVAQPVEELLRLFLAHLAGLRRVRLPLVLGSALRRLVILLLVLIALARRFGLLIVLLVFRLLVLRWRLLLLLLLFLLLDLERLERHLEVVLGVGVLRGAFQGPR